jgi:hypothetical protein
LIFWCELQGPRDGVDAGKDNSQIIPNFGYGEKTWMSDYASDYA